MSACQYLKITMHGLANLLHNTSQSDSHGHTKNDILDSIKRTLQEYNEVVSEENRVSIVDYREKRRY